MVGDVAVRLVEPRGDLALGLREPRIGDVLCAGVLDHVVGQLLLADEAAALALVEV